MKHRSSFSCFISFLCLMLFLFSCDDGHSSRDAREVPRSELFITTWDTWCTDEDSSNAYQVRFPIQSKGTYDFTVDWGDGTSDHITAFDQAETLHTYARKGEYDITIRGTIEGFGFMYYYWEENNYRDNIKLVDVKNWGPVKFHKRGFQFCDTVNLPGFSATDVPLFENWCNIRCMFMGASKFNSDISSWDMSNITDISFMFAEASRFNQPIGSWNVSNVTWMSSTFSGATLFNQDITSWDVSNVESMYDMFYDTVAFNQPIGCWDVSKVENMGGMFASAESFNQYIGSWDVSSVIYMEQMFMDAVSFNQDIGSWDVSNVTDMFMMFYGAESFNRNLNNWDVGNVTDMGDMFDYSGLEGKEPKWY